MQGYRSSEVARLLDLPIGEVRRLARSGLVSPARGARNELRFSFQDLVLLKTAAELVHARIAKAQIRRALGRLHSQLPEGRPLAALRVCAEGGRVVAQHAGARWHADSGQVLLDLEGSDPGRSVAPVVQALARPGCAPPPDAEAWYRWGCDLEATHTEEAKDSYRRALAHDGDHAGAHLNLGRILREEGDACAAEFHLRLAVESVEHRALAELNLGVALEDQGLLDDALLAYARAIESDRTLADAHLNASRVLQRLGRLADALRLLAEYRKLSR